MTAVGTSELQMSSWWLFLTVRVHKFGKVGNSAESVVLLVHIGSADFLSPCCALGISLLIGSVWPGLCWQAESEMTIKASNLQANHLPMRGSLVLAI